jgi:t-SNARE complex subunit (syntaxin)
MSDPSREDEAAAKARRARNIAIALGLVAFVVLVYIVTIVRLGSNVANRF